MAEVERRKGEDRVHEWCNSTVILDVFGNPQEFSSEGHLFRVKTEEENSDECTRID